MKNKWLIPLVILTGLLLLVFYWWTAQKATEEKEKILDEFERVDNALKTSHDSLQQLNDTLLKKIKVKTAE